MCLSTVYAVKKDGSRECICKDIADVRVSGRDLSFVDIMGITKSFQGEIERIDLTDNNIFVRE